MGLHPYYLCDMEGAHTYFLTPQTNEIKKELPENTTLVEKSLRQQPRPREKSLFFQVLFQLNRVLALLLFSLHGIRLIFTKKIDVVHIHSPMYSLLALFGWMLGKKVYITFHGTDFNRIKSSRLYRRFGFLYNRVFAISPHMLADLERIHGKDKVTQVENGIDRKFYLNHQLQRKKQIIAVGALKEEKGFDDLIDGFADFIAVNDDYNQYQLIVIGEGLLRDSLQQQIQHKGLTDKVSLVGHKEGAEVVRYYNESEIFVLSSISEGFPKVLLEAVSCGCKVVATKVGSVSEILNGSPYLCDARDSKGLAALFVEIAKARYDGLAEFYLATLDRYSWEKVQKEYEHYYKG
jgi:glycosyltransferase involved in cell wall biosynthesis